MYICIIFYRFSDFLVAYCTSYWLYQTKKYGSLDRWNFFLGSCPQADNIRGHSGRKINTQRRETRIGTTKSYPETRSSSFKVVMPNLKDPIEVTTSRATSGPQAGPAATWQRSHHADINICADLVDANTLHALESKYYRRRKGRGDFSTRTITIRKS